MADADGARPPGDARAEDAGPPLSVGGHRITGNRRSAGEGVSYDFLHVAIDDAIRPAYVEVLPGERRQSDTSNNR